MKWFLSPMIPKGFLDWAGEDQAQGISKHLQCTLAIRTRDSVAAGSHLKEQIVAYPRKPSGKSKEREPEDNYPPWIRGAGACCINSRAFSAHHMNLSERLLSASLSLFKKWGQRMCKVASWRKWYRAGGGELMGVRSHLCNLKVRHFKEEGLTQSSPSSSNIVSPPNFYLMRSCPKVAVGWSSDGVFFFLPSCRLSAYWWL